MSSSDPTHLPFRYNPHSPVTWLSLVSVVGILTFTWFGNFAHNAMYRMTHPPSYVDESGVTKLTWPTNALCTHHHRLALLSPTLFTTDLFSHLSLSATSLPFSEPLSSVPNGNVFHEEAYDIIFNAGIAKAADALVKGGPESLDYQLIVLTTLLLLDDQARAVYLRDFVPLLKVPEAKGVLSKEDRRGENLEVLCQGWEDSY